MYDFIARGSALLDAGFEHPAGDMEDLSVKKVIERLEKKFNCSLLERKPFIKETINRILEEQHEQEGEKEDSGSDSSSSSSSSSESDSSEDEAKKKPPAKRKAPGIEAVHANCVSFGVHGVVGGPKLARSEPTPTNCPQSAGAASSTIQCLCMHSLNEGVAQGWAGG